MSQQCGDGRCKTQQDRVLLTDSVGGRPGGQSRYTGRRKQGVVDVSVCVCVCVCCVCVCCVCASAASEQGPSRCIYHSVSVFFLFNADNGFRVCVFVFVSVFM